mgnify:CR=1 FL=1
MNDSNEVVAADGSVNEQNNITAFVSDAWDELECWFEAEPGQFEPGLTPQRAITAMQNSGWRPPARVIESVEDLQTLPDRSIILDADDVTYRLNPWDVDREPRWYPFDGPSAFARDFGVQAGDISFPVTVLWEPGDSQ